MTLARLPERALLDALPLALLLVGPDDLPVEANGAAEALFGRTIGHLCRTPLAALFGEDGVATDLVERVRRTHGIVVARETAPGGLLGGRVVDVRAAPLIDREGHVLLAIEERMLPGVLRRQAGLDAAARSAYGLAAMLAHEIRNPLSGIRGAAQLLEKAADDRGRGLARLIRDEVDRIGRLVDGLQTFSDNRDFERRAINIHTVLDHVRDVAASGFAAGATIRTMYDPSLPPVAGERDRLIQIFMNLVKNAIEATDKNSEVLLTTAYRPGLRLADGSGKATELPIEVAVADRGPGVPPGLVDHVFEPFVSAREGGSGLGLALVAKLVAEHGGLVELDNRDDGATFRVLLPAARGEVSDG